MADLREWYEDFKDLTPRTWFQASDVPSSVAGPFVLKGATNSRKHKWSTHMFAAAREDIGPVMLRLLDDPLISEQGVYVREYEPFVAHGTGINGLPITEEYRFFCLDDEILAGGFYWSEHAEDLLAKGRAGVVRNAPTAFVRKSVLPRLKNKIRFVVIDVARREDGVWRLVELNDGTMSGLGCTDADVLYSRLSEVLTP